MSDEIEHDATDSRSRLSGATYLRCMKEACLYLKNNATIRNRDLRDISGIKYDQAIAFFNRAIAEGTMIRHGRASGTRYSLSHLEKP